MNMKEICFFSLFFISVFTFFAREIFAGVLGEVTVD
jgi:hypothetical protein